MAGALPVTIIARGAVPFEIARSQLFRDEHTFVVVNENDPSSANALSAAQPTFKYIPPPPSSAGTSEPPPPRPPMPEPKPEPNTPPEPGEPSPPPPPPRPEPAGQPPPPPAAQPFDAGLTNIFDSVAALAAMAAYTTPVTLPGIEYALPALETLILGLRTSPGVTNARKEIDEIQAKLADVDAMEQTARKANTAARDFETYAAAVDLAAANPAILSSDAQQGLAAAVANVAQLRSPGSIDAALAKSAQYAADVARFRQIRDRIDLLEQQLVAKIAYVAVLETPMTTIGRFVPIPTAALAADPALGREIEALLRQRRVSAMPYLLLAWKAYAQTPSSASRNAARAAELAANFPLVLVQKMFNARKV